jgi:hypothetical protein
LSIGALAGILSSVIIINTRLVGFAGYIIENGVFAGRYQNYGYISATQATQDNYVWIVIVALIIAFSIIGLLIGLLSGRGK